VLRYTLFVLFAIPISAIGQRSSFSIGGEMAVPSNEFNLIAKTGYGGAVRYEYAISKHFSLTGSFDYISLGHKDFPIASTIGALSVNLKINMMPIQVGGKFYLFGRNYVQRGVYVSGELGLNVTLSRATINGVSQSSNDNNFNYAAGLGYRFKNFEFSYRNQILKFSSNQASVQQASYSSFRLLFILNFSRMNKQ